MQINDEMIRKLAMLSRLSFNEEEKELIKNDLEKMITFVNKLNELDTTGVEPLLHVSANVNVLRDDEVFQPVSKEEALANAAGKDNNFFRVPKAINK